MTPEALAARHPRLFHLTRPDALGGIRRRGLLSPCQLLDLFEVAVERREALEHRRRDDSITLTHPVHGQAVLTDNGPLNEDKLAAVLDDGLTPSDWLAMLNDRVFFWADEKRVMSLRSARAYKDQPRLLLVFDTAALAARYAEVMEIAPINTGSTLYNPARRGRSTFSPLLATDHGEWRCRRGLSRPDRIVEVTVVGGIPDVMDYCIHAPE